MFVGLFECEETEQGLWYLKKDGWGDSQYRLSSKFSEEIAGIMCGAIYDEYIYGRRTLEKNAHDADLVRHYLDIKEEIESGIK